MSGLKRRQFITSIASGAVGLGVVGRLPARASIPSAAGQEAAAPKIKKYNDLGKTGLKVSDVSCGAISLFEPNVLRYAYESGVTYFDTAEVYLRQKGETYVGQGLKGVRDKVIITTKHMMDFRQKIDKAAVIKRMDDSLKRLQTDYVDVAMVHSIEDLEPLLQNEEILGAYDELKKAGKVRFTGFSTHNAKVTLKQALETDFPQVVLVIYNHMEGQEIEPLVKAVRAKGIGTVAMKIFAGNQQGNLKGMVGPKMSYPQAAIRWVLAQLRFRHLHPDHVQLFPRRGVRRRLGPAPGPGRPRDGRPLPGSGFFEVLPGELHGVPLRLPGQRRRQRRPPLRDVPRGLRHGADGCGLLRRARTGPQAGRLRRLRRALRGRLPPRPAGAGEAAPCP